MASTPGSWRCEMVTGQDPDSRTPLLIKCHKPAKLRGIAAMCEDCFAQWKESRK